MRQVRWGSTIALVGLSIVAMVNGEQNAGVWTMLFALVVKP